MMANMSKAQKWREHPVLVFSGCEIDCYNIRAQNNIRSSLPGSASVQLSNLHVTVFPQKKTDEGGIRGSPTWKHSESCLTSIS